MSKNFVTLTQLVEQRPWLTERWVRSMVASKQIPHYKPSGGRLLFDLGEVDDMVAKHRVATREENAAARRKHRRAS